VNTTTKTTPASGATRPVALRVRSLVAIETLLNVHCRVLRAVTLTACQAMFSGMQEIFLELLLLVIGLLCEIDEVFIICCFFQF